MLCFRGSVFERSRGSATLLPSGLRQSDSWLYSVRAPVFHTALTQALQFFCRVRCCVCRLLLRAIHQLEQGTALPETCVRRPTPEDFRRVRPGVAWRAGPVAARAQVSFRVGPRNRSRLSLEPLVPRGGPGSFSPRPIRQRRDGTTKVSRSARHFESNHREISELRRGLEPARSSLLAEGTIRRVHRRLQTGRRLESLPFRRVAGNGALPVARRRVGS